MPGRIGRLLVWLLNNMSASSHVGTCGRRGKNISGTNVLLHMPLDMGLVQGKLS